MGGRPPSRRRRGLSAEDREVWELVTRSMRRIASVPRAPQAPSPARHHAAPAPGGAAEPPPISTRSATAPSPGAAGRTLRPTGSPQRQPHAIRWADPDPGPVGRPEAGLDRRTAERLRRGERTPDMAIDLHGMTADRAHAALDRFVAAALRQGARCLLVVTGKGARPRTGDDAPFMSPSGGVLRDAAPRWLRTGPHRSRIVGIYEAHRRHGGAGAFYVYLKRTR